MLTDYSQVTIRAGSVSVFGVGIGIRYFLLFYIMSVRYSVSVSVTDSGLITIAPGNNVEIDD